VALWPPQQASQLFSGIAAAFLLLLLLLRRRRRQGDEQGVQP
jgi:MYXO-CTERM domain-containing protein